MERISITFEDIILEEVRERIEDIFMLLEDNRGLDQVMIETLIYKAMNNIKLS